MQSRHRFLLMFLGLILSWTAHAQPGPQVNQVDFGKKANPDHNISGIWEDHNRQLWVLFFNHVVRFDGTTFYPLDLQEKNHDLLTGFQESPRGQTFLQNHSGQLLLVSGDTVSNYPAHDSLLQYLTYGKVYHVVVDSHAVHYSISRIRYAKVDSGGQLSFPLKEKGINLHGIGIVIRPGEKPLIFKGRDPNLPRRYQQHAYLFNTDLEPLDSIKVNLHKFHFPICYTTLPNGNFLISANGSLLECNDSVLVRRFDHHPRHVTGLLSDSRGGLWISTNHGLRHYPNGLTDTTNSVSLLDGQFCLVRVEDYQGGIWVHSDEKGLLHIPHPRNVHFHDGNYLNNNLVIDVAIYKDTLLYGTGASPNIFYIDQNTLDTGRLTLPDGGPAGRDLVDLYALEDQSKMWISQRGRLLYREGGTCTTIPMDELIERNPTHSAFRLRPSYRKGYEFAGYHKRQFFLGSEDRLTSISDPIPWNITALLVLEDSVLIGTKDGLYSHRTNRQPQLQRIEPSITGRVNEIVFFDNKVWLEVPNGVSVLSKGEPIQRLELPPGGNNLFAQNQDYVWVVNSRFVHRYGKSDGAIPHPDRFAPLPQFAGSRITFHRDHIYLPNKHLGLMKIDVDEYLTDSLPRPHIFIDKLLFDEVSAAPEDSVFTLEPTTNTIRVSYVGVNYRTPEITYRYRLRNSTDKWVYTTENELLLVGLAPGDYALELQGRIGMNPWSRTQRLQFHIVPPIWARTWFILSAISAIVIVCFLLVRYRIRQLKRANERTVMHLLTKQRALHAKLDPHFVFNIISSAQYLIMGDSKERASQFLHLFSKQLRGVLEHSPDLHHSLEAEIQLLRNYIDLERFRLGESFSYTIEVDPAIQPERELVLPLVIQPFIENAIIHGLKPLKKDGRLSIGFRLSEETITITVEDNGIGREASQKNYTPEKLQQQSQGISISRERLELHNQRSEPPAVTINDLTNENQKNAGTQIVIHMKRIHA